jgi:hypothetical protein
MTDNYKDPKELLDDWAKAVANPEMPKEYSLGGANLSDLEPHERDFVLKIRAELEARGIDPSTCYPVSIGDDSFDIANNDSLNLTVTFSYENFNNGG